jgi:aryl-alcohol dehydrogenase-like predicted oxidoreductase
VSIPGITKLPRLEENLDAANLVLSAVDLSNIQQGLAAIDIQGERYPPAAPGCHWTLRETS